MLNILRPLIHSICFLLVLGACNPDENAPSISTGNGPGANPNTSKGPADWLIPIGEVLDGGPGKDGIPSIDDPQFEPVAANDFLREDDLVIGIKVGDLIRAYPHPILDWHEIVNDNVNMVPIALTYCPLTGTAVGWNRMVDGSLTTFGVSGLLYQTNLMPYDRATNSTWSQMRLDCVNGQLIESRAQIEHVVETTWATWKLMFPDSEVMTRATGFARNYNTYPYGDYRTSEQLIFPVNTDNSSLPRKTRVLGVIVNGLAKAFSINSFDQPTTRIITDRVGGTRIVVLGNQKLNFLAAYANSIDGAEPGLEFSPVAEVNNAAVMTDNEGNQWNLFGEAIQGPRKGERLDRVTAFIGYWFAWATFYPDLELR